MEYYSTLKKSGIMNFKVNMKTRNMKHDIKH